MPTLRVQFVVVLMLSFAGCGSVSTSPFPDAADIERVKFKGEDGSDSKAVTIEKEEWRTISQAMLPAYRDANPANWEMYGDIQITLKNGTQITVCPMGGADPQATFAIGESRENLTYYICGSNIQLQKAMERVSR